MDWLELIKTFGVPMVLAGFLLWQHFKGQKWEREEASKREANLTERINRLENIIDTTQTTQIERLTEVLVNATSALEECKEEMRRSRER